MSAQQAGGRGVPLKDSEVQLLRAFIALQITGGTLIAIVLITVLLSRKVHRQPTWISFCVSWIISCLSYTMLTWTGQQTGYTPQHTLCLVQAASVYGAPALVGFTTASLIAELWFNISRIVKGGPNWSSRKRDFFLIGIPYFIWFATLLLALIIGIKQPRSVGMARRRVYCNLAVGISWRVTAALVVLSLAIVIVFEGMIFFKLFNNYRGIRGHPNMVTTIVRSLLFALYGLFIVVVTLVTIRDREAPLTDICFAINPIFVFLLFGTQKDILRQWMFWRKYDDNVPTSQQDARRDAAQQGQLESDCTLVGGVPQTKPAEEA